MLNGLDARKAALDRHARAALDNLVDADAGCHQGRAVSGVPSAFAMPPGKTSRCESSRSRRRAYCWYRRWGVLFAVAAALDNLLARPSTEAATIAVYLVISVVRIALAVFLRPGEPSRPGIDPSYGPFRFEEAASPTLISCLPIARSSRCRRRSHAGDRRVPPAVPGGLFRSRKWRISMTVRAAQSRSECDEKRVSYSEPHPRFSDSNTGHSLPATSTALCASLPRSWEVSHQSGRRVRFP